MDFNYLQMLGLDTYPFRLNETGATFESWKQRGSDRER